MWVDVKLELAVLTSWLRDNSKSTNSHTEGRLGKRNLKLHPHSDVFPPTKLATPPDSATSYGSHFLSNYHKPLNLKSGWNLLHVGVKNSSSYHLLRRLPTWRKYSFSTVIFQIRMAKKEAMDLLKVEARMTFECVLTPFPAINLQFFWNFINKTIHFIYNKSILTLP